MTDCPDNTDLIETGIVAEKESAEKESAEKESAEKESAEKESAENRIVEGGTKEDNGPLQEENHIELDNMEENDSITFEQHSDNYNQLYKTKKFIKASRTLIVNGNSSAFCNKLNKNYYPGLLKQVIHIKNSNVIFLTFDTSNSASLCMSDIIRNYKELRVNYGQYKVFFTFTSHPMECDYNNIKMAFIKYLKSKVSNIDILYFKIYKNKSKCMWCGDFTVDLIEHLHDLIHPMSSNKTFNFDGNSGVFYKFNKKNY